MNAVICPGVTVAELELALRTIRNGNKPQIDRVRDDQRHAKVGDVVEEGGYVNSVGNYITWDYVERTCTDWYMGPIFGTEERCRTNLIECDRHATYAELAEIIEAAIAYAAK